MQIMILKTKISSFSRSVGRLIHYLLNSVDKLKSWLDIGRRELMCSILNRITYPPNGY